MYKHAMYFYCWFIKLFEMVIYVEVFFTFFPHSAVQEMVNFAKKYLRFFNDDLLSLKLMFLLNNKIISWFYIFKIICIKCVVDQYRKWRLKVMWNDIC